MDTVKTVSACGNNAAAVEKFLRLAQSLSQIGAALSISTKDAAPWLLARGQFNLSRRFLRLHKWLDSFTAAGLVFEDPKRDSVGKMLGTAKFASLGMYFFLEMLTTFDVMGVMKTAWASGLALESQKFWFYGLVCSLLLSLWDEFSCSKNYLLQKQGPDGAYDSGVGELRTGTGEVSKENSTEKSKAEKKGATKTSSRGLPYKQLAIDGCDLLIPGSVLGWTDVSPLTVSVAMMISTMLALSDMWVNIQSQITAVQAQKKK